MTELETITAFINSPAFALMSDNAKDETYAKQKELAIAAIQQKIDEYIMPIIKDNGLALSVDIKEIDSITEVKKDVPVEKEFSVDDIIAEYPDYQGMILDKELDWSLLNHGFTVPRVFHFAVSHACSKAINPGSNVKIKIQFDHKEYAAAVHNDKNGVMQFDFSKSLTEAIQSKYPDTYSYMISEKAKATNKKAKVKLPEHLQHEFTLCHCKEDDSFILIEKK